jgi:hypothetical protein
MSRAFIWNIFRQRESPFTTLYSRCTTDELVRMSVASVRSGIQCYSDVPLRAANKLPTCIEIELWTVVSVQGVSETRGISFGIYYKNGQALPGHLRRM